MKRFLKMALASSLLVGSLVAEEVIHHSKETRVHSIPLNIIDSRNPIGFLNSQAIFLADQLERNLDKKYLTSAVMVTSFLSLDDLTQTNSLGRLLSESLIHELQVRRWKVIDARLVKDIIINQKGEFALSRDIKNIKDSYNVSGVVTGTYTIADTGVIVNAKVMDIESGVITSSGQISIPLNGVEALLFNFSHPKSVKIKGSFE
jgi:TolB-like protein